MAPKRRVTAADVAKAAGVSQSTVSRVFCANSGIQPRNKERILQVAAELGYHPNALARGLTTNQSQIVALVGSGLHDTFFSYVLCGLIDKLQRRGLQMLVFNLNTPDQLDSVIERLHQYNVDGMLLTSAYLDEPAIVRMLEIGKPVILINRSLPGVDVKAVCCDNADGGRQVVDHFVELGRKRLAMISGPATSYTAHGRSLGYRARLEALGIPLRFAVQTNKLSHEEGQAAMSQLLESGTEIDAVFCTNDILALGAIDTATHTYHRRIPEDIAIAAFDGNRSSGWPSYQLTTIEQPIDKLIDAAIDTLDDMLQGFEVFPSCKLFKGTLARRASTVGLAQAH